MVTLYDDRYEFVRDLGSGGFGRVFLAKERVSGRLVAIKQLINRRVGEQRIILKEIQTIARFNHPGIVTYFHHFSSNSDLFIVMEYCEYGPVDTVVIKPEAIIHYLIQLAETLQTVHEMGIVHRDIKPGNILLTKEQHVKIADFGIANDNNGTLAYLSPVERRNEAANPNDPRADIYALGVTMLELLTGKNPFSYKPLSECEQIHAGKRFGMRHLPDWQQEIILKAIQPQPELRFQTMTDFAEALQLRQTPYFLNTELIKGHQLAEQTARDLDNKKWSKAAAKIDYLKSQFPNSVSVLRQVGRFYVLTHRMKEAELWLNRALQKNPRLEIHKELAMVYLSTGNYPGAISLLSDYLHRYPTDFEAYNLLLQCYFETGRYEAGLALGKMVLDIEPKDPILANNYYLCHIMQDLHRSTVPDVVLRQQHNPFVDHNRGVCQESELSHDYLERPTMKSKLLFADYRFRKLQAGTLYISSSDESLSLPSPCKEFLIGFGRTGYEVNTVQVRARKMVSRRHCVIINALDDTWLCDLDSYTGTFLNGESVQGKVPVIGRAGLRIASVEFQVTTHPEKLL